MQARRIIEARDRIAQAAYAAMRRVEAEAALWLDPANIDEPLPRRTTLITARRADHPGVVETRPIRRGDGTFIDHLALGVRRADAGGPRRRTDISQGPRGHVRHPGPDRRGRSRRRWSHRDPLIDAW